jgi:hypothetical protein
LCFERKDRGSNPRGEANFKRDAEWLRGKKVAQAVLADFTAGRLERYQPGGDAYIDECAPGVREEVAVAGRDHRSQGIPMTETERAIEQALIRAVPDAALIKAYEARTDEPSEIVELVIEEMERRHLDF